MPIVSVTRTVMARARHIPPFMRDSLRVGVEARRCPGYLAGAVRATSGPEFWTLTVWEGGRAMIAFRNSGVHGEVMPRLAGWASYGAYAAWRTDDPGLPTWDEVQRRIEESCHFGTVDAPSAEHTQQRVRPAPRRSLSVPIPARRATKVRTAASPG